MTRLTWFQFIAVYKENQFAETLNWIEIDSKQFIAFKLSCIVWKCICEQELKIPLGGVFKVRHAI